MPAFNLTDLMFVSMSNGAINSSAAEIELAPAVAGRVAMIFLVYLESAGSTNLTFQSGAGTAATAISGAIPQVADDILELDHPGGYPVLIADDLNESITVANSGTVSVQGFTLFAHAPRPSE